MDSFDIKSLVANVPINDLLQDFKKYNFPIPSSDLLELAKLCVVNLKSILDGIFF